MQIIKDGGWHFSYLQSPKNLLKKISSFSHGERNKPKFANEENILEKIKSFSHGEFNTDDFTDEVNIEEKVKLRKDIFNRGYSYNKVEIDNTFPKYIIENKEKLKDWILK